MTNHRIASSASLLAGAALFALLAAFSGQAVAFDDDAPPPHRGNRDHWGDRPDYQDRRGDHEGHGRGGARGGRGGGRGGGLHGPITQEDIDRMVEVLEDHRPDLAERVRSLDDPKDPEQLRKVLGEFGHRLRRLMRMKKQNPEMYALKTEDNTLYRKSAELADRLRATQDDNERETLTEELQQTIEHHFDVRQQMQERRLEKLEQRLQKLRDRVQGRADARQDLIAQRVAELTGDPAQARW